MIHEAKKIPDSERIIGERRGVFTSSGVPILISPTREQLNGLPKDPRLTYFSTLGSAPILLDVDLDERSSNSIVRPNSPYFQEYCLKPLNERLRKDFPHTPSVAIRGSACSIEGPIPYIDIMKHPGSGTIRSIAQIMLDGTDTGLSKTSVGQLDLRDETSVIKGYPATYMQFYSVSFRSFLELQNGKPDAVFPLFLVYDLKFFDQEKDIIKLPQISEENDKPLLKAYILDHPYF